MQSLAIPGIIPPATGAILWDLTRSSMQGLLLPVLERNQVSGFRFQCQEKGTGCRAWGSAWAVRQKATAGMGRGCGCAHGGGCVGNRDSPWFCTRPDTYSEHWPWDMQKSLEAFLSEKITQPRKWTMCFLYVFHYIQRWTSEVHSNLWSIFYHLNSQDMVQNLYHLVSGL